MSKKVTRDKARDLLEAPDAAAAAAHHAGHAAPAHGLRRSGVLLLERLATRGGPRILGPGVAHGLVYFQYDARRLAGRQ